MFFVVLLSVGNAESKEFRLRNPRAFRDLHEIFANLRRYRWKPADRVRVVRGALTSWRASTTNRIALSVRQVGGRFFEFIIGYLGGLVTAAEMTGDAGLTATAAALGRALLDAVRPTGGFFSARTLRISTHGPNSFSASVDGGSPCIAESGTFQLEFLALAELANESDFVRTAVNVDGHIWMEQGRHGLLGPKIGSCEDSCDESARKCSALTGGISPPILREYLGIVADILRRLVLKTLHDQLHGIGVSHCDTRRDVTPEVEHVAAFAGGMLGLGVSRATHPRSRTSRSLGLPAQFTMNASRGFRPSACD
jgi:hypothetical protein